MSTYSPDLADVPIEVFGGYCPAIPPSDLPPGAADIAQDVMFPQGGLRQRGGLLAVFGPNNSGIPATAQVLGLKSYLTPTLAQRLLAWDSAGNFYKESPQGTLSLVGSRPYLNLLYQSQTIFGREYQAFFNSLGGADIPRQFDDVNWDRVSQDGPGAPPVVANLVPPSVSINNTGAGAAVAIATITPTDPKVTTYRVPKYDDRGHLIGYTTYSVTVYTTLTVVTSVAHGFTVAEQLAFAGVTPASFNFATTTVTVVVNATTFKVAYNSSSATTGAGGTATPQLPTLVRQSTIVTATATAAHGFQVGWNVQIAIGAGWDGTFAITSVPTPTTFTYVQAGADAINNATGTATIIGQIVAGLHQVSVCFITRQGFITKASPPAYFNAAGSQQGAVSQIATGPPNVVARLLLFTPVITPPATTGSFYSITATMLIADNVTTAAVVDFSDTILIASFQANYLFSQLELGESAFSIGYNSRLAWLGERAKLANFTNLSFNGGFSASGLVPLGWTVDPVNGAGGNGALNSGLPADWGDAYVITGDGATAIRGKIAQSASQDYLGVAIIAPNTSYTVRVRARLANGLAQGTVHINLQSTTGAFVTAGLAIPAAQLTAQYQEFTAQLTDAPLGVVPADLQLQVYADGTPTNLGQFIVDSIQVVPTNAPYNTSTVRLSHAFNPESYDATTGQIQVRPSDGQQLRAGFPLRNNLYLAKDHYLCYTADDGVNEPAGWTLNEVSATVGICGPNAVDWNEEWAVFAERSGLYICWGSDPVKITTEIQTDASGTGKISWESINWQFGHTIWVRIDRVNKMILVGAPVFGSQVPNVVFMMDYKWLDSAEEIAGSPLVTWSGFSGKMLAHGKGRRWALWSIAASSMTFAERVDGTAQPFFGSSTANGKIYRQVDCAQQPTDDGTPLSGIWRSYAIPSHSEEQVFQLGAHRKLAGYLKFSDKGVGQLFYSISTAARTTNLRVRTLSVNSTVDGERPLNMKGERFFLTVSTQAFAGGFGQGGFGQGGFGGAANPQPGWFQLEKLVLSLKKDAVGAVRGVSA
jgi:hypothetical protein